MSKHAKRNSPTYEKRIAQLEEEMAENNTAWRVRADIDKETIARLEQERDQFSNLLHRWDAMEFPVRRISADHMWAIIENLIADTKEALKQERDQLRDALQNLLDREWQDDEGQPSLLAARKQAQKALDKTDE